MEVYFPSEVSAGDTAPLRGILLRFSSPRFSAEAPRAAAGCAGPGFVLKPEKGSARKASFQPINLEREDGWRYVLLE